MPLPLSTMPPTMPLRHALLAVAIMAVWGTNYVVIRLGLDHFPPLLFAALRFGFAIVPAIFFVRRPDVPWRNLATYGLILGTGQFTLLFTAMRADITSGLASLVIQMQVFFTIGLAVLLRGERVRRLQMVALGLALAGLTVILAHTDTATTPLGLALVLSAALCWATGNIVARDTPGANMLGYVVWSSLFAAPSLFLLSFATEGWPAIRDAVASAAADDWAAVAYQAFGNTLFGFAAWGWLLARYSTASVAPMSLLVPVFGFAASAVWLGEPLQAWKWLAACLVLAGLGVNLLGPRWRKHSA